jgi:hypothetical protein
LAGCPEEASPPDPGPSPTIPASSIGEAPEKEPPTSEAAQNASDPVLPGEKAEAPAEPPRLGLTRLGRDEDVWIDEKAREVVMVGQVCLINGPLEMFACPRRTKEHESVISIKTKASTVHAGLLALGAVPGHPAIFGDAFKPAEGPVIEVLLEWKDAAGKVQKGRAQDWIRNRKTGESLESEWVFAGSKEFRDDRTGEVFYMADDGDMICVSNFSDAMLDLTVESSETMNRLDFEAFTERIPPKKTPVVVSLRVKLEAPRESAN